MFLLVPYAHEKQNVQRLPWVTFSLIALNVLVFLFTHFASVDESKRNEAFLRFAEYYYTHPYLTIPYKAKKLFSEKELSDLALMKEGVDLTQISSETRRLEQAELDLLAQKVLAAQGEDPYQKWGYAPGNSKWYTLITCQFIHSGWFHLIGNMLFLYLAGCSIEDLWGRPLYLGFYLLSGVAATLVHELKYPNSLAPLVGASGAIAGLMGAFLLRLYNTRIHFFYLLFFFRIRWGAFRAPAFIMLPLWLLQQLFYASLADETAGVAFWAHIGGFLFGFAFAYVVKISRIEGKFIAPAIEKKVSLPQNPDFLRAMEISERGDFPNALILLEKVVRREPTHLDAYMEMRRIAEIKKDSDLYTKYSAAIFDILLRNRDNDLFEDLYRQYQSKREQLPLPAKTIFAIANHFEEIQDYSAALQHYEELCAAYPQDALALKAWNKVYKICFDRLSLREKGIQAFQQCSQHALATDQWKAVLAADSKRYAIPAAVASQQLATEEARQPSVPVMPSSDLISTGASVAAQDFLMEKQLASAVIASPLVQEPKKILEGDLLPLPDTKFDEAAVGDAISCQFVKMTLRGMILKNSAGATGILPWKRIDCISVAKIRATDALLFDLVVKISSGTFIYRIRGGEISFERIFPGVEQTFAEAYQNFVGIVANNSGARCIPSREACCGPSFVSFSDEDRYRTMLKEKLTTDEHR